MTKIILTKDIEVADGLPYAKACRLMEAANASKAGDFYAFSIELRDDGWTLKGRPLAASHEFIDDPDGFVLEVEP